jgi:flagellar hook-associated protein 3 FlgL
MLQRVTTTTMTRTLNADIQTNARSLVDIQRRISSGKELHRPSDAPASVLRALDQRSELRRYAQYERNISDANAWTANTDATLMSVVDRLERVRALTIGSVNSGASQEARNAAAAEIEGIRDEVIGLANTTYLGRPLFAGVVDTSEAFASTGAYQGDGGAVTRTVAPGTSIQVNLDGEHVFGTFDGADPANGNLFQVLDRLALDIRAGDFDEMSAGLTRVGDAADRVAIAQAEIGTRARQIEGLNERNGDVSLAIEAELAEVEDVDYAKALIELNSREFAYQAALSVTAKIIQPSLLDFLR